MNEHASNSVIMVTVADIKDNNEEEIDQATSKQATNANTTCCGI